MSQHLPPGAPSERTRRSALAAGLAAPLAAAPAAATTIVTEEVARLTARHERANSAFIAGDMTAWYAAAGPIGADFTLMQPFGGPASHGFDASPARLAEMGRYFQGGEGSLELAQTYAGGNLVVLVFVERQHGRVGGLPDQDWSLRVTQVYRRGAGGWELVHRHADPMVRNLGLERTAALARGSGAA